MNCKECGKELTDKEAIAALEKRVAGLESDLVLERLKGTQYVPYYPVPYPEPMRQPWLDGPVWTAPHTGTPLPHADYVTWGGVGGGSSTAN